MRRSAADAPARIHAFAETRHFARDLARETGIPAMAVHVHRFPDGESRVRTEPPPGRHAVLVRSLHDPNGAAPAA